MKELRTIHDLYLSIDNLAEEYKSSDRSLEEYLRALLQVGNRFKAYELLSLSDFYTLICISFTALPLEFDEYWRNNYEQLPYDLSGFNGWQATLIRQIVDLREMKENGTLANKYCYLGVYSPRNSIWYNFDPLGYLECAMTGTRWSTPEFEITTVTWDEFNYFITCGRCYE